MLFSQSVSSASMSRVWAPFCPGICLMIAPWLLAEKRVSPQRCRTPRPFDRPLRAEVGSHFFSKLLGAASRLLIELNAFNEKLRAPDYSHSSDVHFKFRSTKEDPQHDRFGSQRPGFCGIKGGSRPGQASGQVPPRPHAFQSDRPDRPRAKVGAETGGGLRISGKYFLAAERSGSTGARPVARCEHESARRQAADLPEAERFPL